MFIHTIILDFLLWGKRPIRNHWWGKVILSEFTSGTVEAHSKIEQNQYDSSKVGTRKDIHGYLYLDGDGATPLNYSEVLRLDSDGLVYCTVTLWQMPYKEKTLG